MMPMSKLFSTLVLLILLQAGPLLAEQFDPNKLQGLGDTRYHPFDSETLGHALHIYVRVPESSSNNPDRQYPTVYLLDGGINYPLLSSYYHYLQLGEEVPEMIIVGISYGSDSFEGGNFRSTDFTAPSEEREWWGEAPTFQSVIGNELLPMIEERYASNPNKRIIFGQSLGGQFVLYSALSQPELFWGHIASNPALHRNLGYFLDWNGDSKMPLEATRLFVSEGEFNDARFKRPATEWIEYWSDPERSRPFVLEVQTLPGQSHLSSVTQAFRQGLLWLFSDDR
jgi:predicted alpha/beta superfamily hydrolase